MKIYNVIGLMSGTSLDGLDIAFCQFEKKEQWSYRIINAETIDYTPEFRNRLEKVFNASGLELTNFDHEFGKYLGREVKKFIEKYQLKPDLIASHGHTIYHQPEKGFTLQIGNGADLYAATGIPLVNDFRSADVAAGGQGAPLVPIGDKLLFSDFPMCLNLGGIANISFDVNDKRIAYDICPVNIVMNVLANRMGMPYDRGGQIASKGKIIKGMFQELEDLEFYKKNYPKSLGREWIEKTFMPVINKYDSVPDVLATMVCHIGTRVNKDIEKYFRAKGTGGKKAAVLVTGGGAFNEFLIRQLNDLAPEGIIFHVPDNNIVSFKEALIFAFLGVLRIRNEVNCLSAVTGATKDVCGGVLHGKSEGLF